MIFDLHSDILSHLGAHPGLWESSLRSIFTQNESFGGIWVAWINEPHRTPEGTPREFLRLRSLAQNLTGSALVQTSGDLLRIPQKGLYPIVLGVEGLDSLPFSAAELYELGFRHAMLTWMHSNAFAGGNHDPNLTGLSARGKAFVTEMERLSMLIDTSHLNEKSFWDLCAHTDAPIMASHSNARALCDCPRNLTDAQIKELSRRKGLIGLNVVADFVRLDAPPRYADLGAHLRHILDLTGNESLPAFGPDWCAFLNPAFRFVEGYNSAADSAKFGEVLSAQGFSDALIAKASRQNALEYLQTNLPKDPA